jgi:hypothetical protein
MYIIISSKKIPDVFILNFKKLTYKIKDIYLMA